MANKIKVFKRRYRWHWWCACCMGGDWHTDIRMAWADALVHAHAQHPR